ncbi:MAG: hypothetical protein ACPGVT_12260 [Maricaulaceae bacterium]
MRLALSVSVIFIGAVAAHAADKVVRVTGIGETAQEARDDAVRQAVQQTTSQLIVADRRIEDDEIIQDRVISTMNAHVSKFKALGYKTDEMGVSVNAEVHISESGLSNFIAASGGGSSKVDGLSMAQSFALEDGRQANNALLLERQFGDFPRGIQNVKVTNIKRTKDKQYILHSVSVSTPMAWRQSLKGLLPHVISGSPNDPEICFDSQTGFSSKELIAVSKDVTIACFDKASSTMKAEKKPKRRKVKVDKLGALTSRTNITLGGRRVQLSDNNFKKRKTHQSHRASMQVQPSGYCRMNETNNRCANLDVESQFSTSFPATHGRFDIEVGVIPYNKNGQSTLKSGECIQTKLLDTKFGKPYAYRNYRLFEHDARFALPSGSYDMSETTGFAIEPFRVEVSRGGPQSQPCTDETMIEDLRWKARGEIKVQ